MTIPTVADNKSTAAAAAAAARGVNDPIRIVANIFISFIGAGVLGLPYAFKEAGMLEGTAVMVLVSVLSVKAMLQLVECKYKVLATLKATGGIVAAGSSAKKIASARRDDGGSAKNGVAKGQPVTDDGEMELMVPDDIEPSKDHFIVGPDVEISYSDVAFAALGRSGRFLIDAALLVSQIGFCCAYLIFITENLATFYGGLTKNQWLVLVLPPLFFLTLIPDLGRLAVFSLLAQVSNIFAFAVVFWFDFDHLHLVSNLHRKEICLSGLPFFFSIAIYCFEGAGMILSLEHSVSEARRPAFNNYFVWTIVSITILYVTFGASGYLSYGPDTRDIITLNLPDGLSLNFASIVKGCLCFSLFFTYPVMLFPITSLIEKRLQLGSALMSRCLRFALVTFSGFVVVGVPRFADLMALVGATCCTLLAFIMPALIHLILFQGQLKRRQLTLNYVLVGVGVFGAVLGTWDALKKVARLQ